MNQRDDESQPRRTGNTFDDPVTYAVIGAAQKVHTALGVGFVESTYHAALCRELTLRDIAHESEREFKVYYEGALCGIYRADLVVAGDVIVELKAVSRLCEEHRLQTISYLKASGFSRTLLLNVGSISLEVRRFSNKNESLKSGNPVIPLKKAPMEADPENV
jgi:GxxExxY protein